MITYTATRLGNGEFLLKCVDQSLDGDGFELPPRTLLTLVLTEEQAMSLAEQIITPGTCLAGVEWRVSHPLGVRKDEGSES